MKSSTRGTTAGRTKSLRRKAVFLVIASLAVLLFCNYIALMSRVSLPSESAQDRMADFSWAKSTNAWKQLMMRNETSTIGIHILRPGAPITNIIVLGERHSGTTFFTNYLSDCFPRAKVGDIFVNKKHWIQHDPDYVQRAVSEYSTPPLWREIAKHNHASRGPDQQYSNDYFQNSLVLVLFRNPYDW